MAIRTHLIPIGNSRGVRLPRAVIEQAGLGDELELEAVPGQVTIRAVRQSQRGWADAAKALHAAGGDTLLDPAVATTFDHTEWTW
jgi:antitoxin MazE